MFLVDGFAAYFKPSGERVQWPRGRNPGLNGGKYADLARSHGIREKNALLVRSFQGS